MTAMRLVHLAMMASMMVAMMAPSVAPTLWRHHRHLRAQRMPRAGQLTALFAAGYASVWAAIGVALSALSTVLAPATMMPSMHAPIAPWATGVVVLCAGVLQRTRWKARQLLRCRQACVTAGTASGKLATAWRTGWRLGIDCGLSCAAPMAVLVVAGLMDARSMAAVTAAITAERLAPDGARVARLSGTLALAAGLAVCVRTAIVR